jgi:Family of unknown function (DUF6502)
MTTQPTLVLDRVLRVLQPLVRLLVKNGVGYPAFAAALKRVFLDAARAELAHRGMAETDSAITLLCGVHRRDVRELTRGAAAAAPPPPALGMAGEVVARWLSQPDTTDRRGRPLTLPRGDDATPGSFDALVAGISRDVRPRAVADELLRLGVLREDADGLHLDRSGFVPREGFEEMSWLMAQNLRDHAAAATANLQGEGNFLEQAVYVDRLGADSAAALQKVSIQAWKAAFKSVLAEAQARFDADERDLPAEAPRHRARFGVYFYSEQEDPTP